MAPAAMPQAPQSPSLKFMTAVKSDAQWEEHVMQAPPTTLVVCDIYTKWCGPCVALGKRLSNLSADYLECAPRTARPLAHATAIASSGSLMSTSGRSC